MSKVTITIEEQTVNTPACNAVDDPDDSAATPVCLLPGVFRFHWGTDGDGEEDDALNCCGPHFVAAMVALGVEVAKGGVEGL